MLYIVSYDLVQDRHRTRLLRELRGMGVRVQYSVVECIVRGTDTDTLATMARQALCEPEDSVRIYPLCRRCRQGIVIVGSGELTTLQDSYTA